MLVLTMATTTRAARASPTWTSSVMISKQKEGEEYINLRNVTRKPCEPIQYKID